MQYGLSKKQLLEFAYRYAVANGKRYPKSWDKNKAAVEDWWKRFKARSGTLSIRKPEATSLARCTSFIKKNVSEFFNNLFEVVPKYKFLPQNI